MSTRASKLKTMRVVPALGPFGSRTPRGRVALAALAAWVLTACSGDGDPSSQLRRELESV